MFGIVSYSFLSVCGVKVNTMMYTCVYIERYYIYVYVHVCMICMYVYIFCGKVFMAL